MKRKFNWAIPGLLAMIMIIIGIASMQSIAATSPDLERLANQCSSCHTMDSHVEAWKQSSHQNVACTACHADPGVMGWAKMQYGQVQMLMSFRRGETDLSRIASSVPNERCINCHAQEMPWIMQDLKPPVFAENGEPQRVAPDELSFLRAIPGHDLHLTRDEPLSCTQCHQSISHGPAPENRAERVDLMHEACIQCHLTEELKMTVQTSITCSACHVDLVAVSPEDHKSSAFRALHGKAATDDLTNCQQCHLNPGLGVAQAPHGLVATLATSKDLVIPSLAADRAHPSIPTMPPGSISPTSDVTDACASCHGVTMPHPTSWLTQHTAGFAEKPALCATCHGTRDQGFNMTVTGDPRVLSITDPSCTSCHAQPMSHPVDWLPKAHTIQANMAPVTCEQCHSPANEANPTAAHASPRFCLDCHLGKFSHPRGYTIAHQSVMRSYNGNQVAAGCTQCHTPAENSCTSCHTAGVGSPAQQWHPVDFVGTHKNVMVSYLGSQTAAGCTQCHTTAVNSCTECHTAGVGNQQQWHPPNFWISHARTTSPSDAASCKDCHNYVQPSCSECHRRY